MKYLRSFSHRLFAYALVLSCTTSAVYAQSAPESLPQNTQRSAAQIAAQGWQDNDYAQYNTQDFFALSVVQAPLNPKAMDNKLLHAAVFYATNRAREANNVKPFLHSPALEQAAAGHSQAMSQHNFFSHTSVITGMETMSKRLSKAGVSGSYIAENIAQFSGLNYTAGKPVYTPDTNGGYFSYTPKGTPLRPRTYAEVGETVVKQWMDSPGHRRNILNPSLRYLGVGLSAFEKKSFYNMLYFNATQNFSS